MARPFRLGDFQGRGQVFAVGLQACREVKALHSQLYDLEIRGRDLEIRAAKSSCTNKHHKNSCGRRIAAGLAGMSRRQDEEAVEDPRLPAL